MQTCRVVAYHLLSLERFDDAVKLLELVLELAPAEPHSHTDLAFSRLLRLRNAADPSPEHARAEMGAIVGALERVVAGTEWPSRFVEIEWPALILLSWAVAWAEASFP